LENAYSHGAHTPDVQQNKNHGAGTDFYQQTALQWILSQRIFIMYVEIGSDMHKTEGNITTI
jgi:hypothetical protein